MTTATDSRPKTNEQLREVTEDAMAHFHVPGVAVGIINGADEIVGCYGITSVENPLPVTPDTLFQIGSTTKTITALTAMRLVEQGKLALDEPVRTYLPDLELADSDVTVGITLRHLLTHMGGFDGDYFADFGRGDDALARGVDSMKSLSQISGLGEVWSYCNAGFYIAGRMIEVVTGQSFEAAVRELVLDPIGMTMSFFFPDEAMTYRFATGHVIRDEMPTTARPWPLPRLANAAGGISASIRDNLRYARFMMGDGTTEDGTRLVSPETFDLMKSSLVPAAADEGMGLTWMSREVEGVRLVRHGGGTNGQVSAFLFVPAKQFALAVLTNASQQEVLHAVQEWALKEYLGIEEPKPTAVEATAEQLDALVGAFESIVNVLEVSADGDKLAIQLKPKLEAMAAVSSDPPPPIPGFQASMCGTDRIVALDGLLKDAEGEYIRRNGEIRWLRIGGRLHTKTA